MTIDEAKAKGIEHAKKGLSLTPFDCKDVDAEIFAFCKASMPTSTAKVYAKLRGAFNKGWCKIVAQD